MTSALALLVATLGPLAAWRWVVARRHADLLQDQLEQLSSAAREGLPLAEALDVLAEESPRRLRKRLSASATAYRQQGSLGEALRARPRWCPEPVRALVKAGEQQGALEPVLEVARVELAEGPTLRAENFQRVGYPVILISLVLWLALFMDEVIAPFFVEIGDRSGFELWPPDATQGITLLLATLAASLALWLLALSSTHAQRGLLALGLAVPGLRAWIACRHHARWLGRVGALLTGEAPLPAALARVAELEGGRDLRRAAALAAEGAPVAETLGAALGRSGCRDVPRLLLTTQAHGVGPGCLLYAARLRGEARRRLGIVGELLQPVPTLFCGLVAWGLASGVFTALGRLQQAAAQGLGGGW